MVRRIAVIAGTRVDTQMGVDFIRNKNSEDAAVYLEPIYCPVSEDCDAQIKFQYSDGDAKRHRIDEVFDPEIARGTRDFFIYCNSLSGAFDFDSYAEIKSAELGDLIRIYTPLQIYRELGNRYSRIGVMAANNLSAFGIENVLMSANSDIYVIGTGNMSIVRAIEDGVQPREIVERCGLRSMLDYMKSCGAEAVILGCTHFPYFKKELAECTDIPLIDPADLMHAAVLSR